MPQDYPAPKEGTFVAKDFKFHTGEVMPELRLHYRTIGEPTGQPVLILHGTSGSGARLPQRGVRRRAVRRGQPLDATKYFIILPDNARRRKIVEAVGRHCGRSFRATITTTWSTAQYRLVTEGLGIKHLRLVIGNSMGGMHTWLWGVAYPGFHGRAGADGGAAEREMSSRNWMMRRMMIELIRNDPDWNDGNYTTQPKALRLANAFFNAATNGGTLRLQKRAPTREEADKLVDEMLAAPVPADANDFLYQ